MAGCLSTLLSCADHTTAWCSGPRSHQLSSKGRTLAPLAHPLPAETAWPRPARLRPGSSSCCSPQERAKAFSSYKDYLGKDITSLVILPVWIMQPFTMLQVGAP